MHERKEGFKYNYLLLVMTLFLFPNTKSFSPPALLLHFRIRIMLRINFLCLNTEIKELQAVLVRGKRGKWLQL